MVKCRRYGIEVKLSPVTVTLHMGVEWGLVPPAPLLILLPLMMLGRQWKAVRCLPHGSHPVVEVWGVNQWMASLFFLLLCHSASHNKEILKRRNPTCEVVCPCL